MLADRRMIATAVCGPIVQAAAGLRAASGEGRRVTTVFISHSHVDKPVARRVERFLRLHGVRTWLDERELRLGTQLDPTIRGQLTTCDLVVVIASQAAAQSPWVARELEVATGCDPALPICPLYVADVVKHPLFAPHLGIDAREPYRFTDNVRRLAEAVVGKRMPTPGRAAVKAVLDEIARRSPGVELLLTDLRREGGLRLEHVDLVAAAEFHDLDDALELLARMGSTDELANATATLFSRTGVGTAALLRHLAAGFDVRASAVGVTLASHLLPPAIRLLSPPQPVDDLALSSLLFVNRQALAAHRDDVIRLITQPPRGPGGFATDAAVAALRVVPGDDALLRLWQGWIFDGRFDGVGHRRPDDSDPHFFAVWSAQELRDKVAGWDWICDRFLKHVRILIRSTDVDRVGAALLHLHHLALKEHPRLAEAIHICQDAMAIAEWHDWEREEEMIRVVYHMTSAARGVTEWDDALEVARRSFGRHFGSR